MIASVSFTLATIYLLIWFRERRSWAYLCFFVLAVGVIGLATGEMAAMHAKSSAEYGAAIRWGHFAYGFIAVGSLGFVHFYFGTGKRWLLGAALGFRQGSERFHDVRAVKLDLSCRVHRRDDRKRED